MQTNNQNKEQQCTHIQQSNRLFQVLTFSSTLNDWFNLDPNIRNAESLFVFKSRFLFSIRPVQISIYNIFDPTGLKFLSCLRLGFSHLNEHGFRHSFQNCLRNPYIFLV